jgi:hypothetical protein
LPVFSLPEVTTPRDIERRNNDSQVSVSPLGRCGVDRSVEVNSP